MKAIFILGPTAVGKSDIAISLAKKFNGEIISCDSVQIFKGLDIGSAKIKKEEMQGVTHHLIDIKNPNETFTAFEFVNTMRQKIKEITERGKLPFVVGGTSLYVKSLINGYNFGGVGVDENLRKELEIEWKEKGVQSLYERLKKLDNDMAASVDKHNPLRVMRAIEIASSKGQKTTAVNDIESLIFAIVMERSVLYERINKRVDIMLQNGLVEEVQKLKKQGLTRDNQSMKAIGYKEVLSFLDGEINYEEMAELIKKNSRNYAKRQLTFLRGMENVNYVEAGKTAENIISGKIKEWLQNG